VEDGGPDGGAAIKNTAAFDGAELCGGQEVGEEGQEASKQFGEQLIVGA
jgi:hypothetical protein